MYAEHRAVHHLDIVSENALYRVFLLASTLQVDLSFWPSDDFRALGDRFRLLFGASQPSAGEELPSASELIGFGWLYALHARSSIARGRVWQAEYMISGLRDQALALACLRQRLPVFEGRGMDRLPAQVASQSCPLSSGHWIRQSSSGPSRPPARHSSPRPKRSIPCWPTA